jgi:FAD/FMN-containing dehydrogenase
MLQPSGAFNLLLDQPPEAIAVPVSPAEVAEAIGEARSRGLRLSENGRGSRLHARRRRVDADSEPELFWALRGGGGDFGVATAIECELLPIPSLYAGVLFFPP